MERPFNLSKVSSLAGTTPWAPFEAAPHVWIAPLAKAPRLTPQGAQGEALKAEPASTTPIPLAADLRTNGTDGPIQNQQMVGVCWTFAVSTVMENSFRRNGRNDLVAPMHILSSGVFDQIWSKGQSTALIGEGSWPYDPVKACKLNESKGEVWCSDAYKVQAGSWKSDPALVLEKQHADQNGVYRLINARELPADATLPQTAAAAIGKGLAVYVGMNIDTNIWGYQRVKDGRIPDWTNGSAGHAVVLVAYRPTATGREFLVHNSWGPDWGDKGYAWVSDKMIATFTDQALLFEAQATNAPDGGATTSTKTPTGGLPFPLPVGLSLPSPIPAPTAGCPNGQVKDMVFGQCAAACAGGSPAVAGLCAGGPSPTPTKSSCSNGQVPDWITGKCANQCANGQSSIEGMCFP